VLTLTEDEGTLSLVISDNGRGFDSAAERGDGHHGLANLQARAEALGGSLEVKSAPGVGTQVAARIPRTLKEVGRGG
jgi:signal transduction histidine kinase